MRTRPLPDWSTLSFSYTETDFLYTCLGDTAEKPVWQAGRHEPCRELSFSPAAAFMSYGLGIFEGLKAQRAEDGRVLLFRHQANAERFRRSAERLLLEPFPAELFVQAIEETTRRNHRFIPPHGMGSLYIRPMEHAVEAKLGLSACTQFLVSMYSSPVGGYFAKGKSAGPEGVRLRLLEQGRVAPGGTGASKCIGNYAGGIYIANQWKKKGFDDVLYLDAWQRKHLAETSGSNVFVKLKGGPLVTPKLDDQILPGITRDSVIRVARETIGVKVEERDVTVEEALGAEEVFCCGTAWTVQSVREIEHHDKAHAFPAMELRREILSVLRGIQTGQREDPFGWTTEVRLEPAESRR